MAVLIHQPLVLVIAGGVFVMEASVRHPADELVSLHPQTLWHRPPDFFDGADPSSFRKERLVRIPGGDAILYFVRAVRGGGVEHFEDQMMTTDWSLMINLANKDVLVIGLGGRGRPLASLLRQAERECRR